MNPRRRLLYLGVVILIILDWLRHLLHRPPYDVSLWLMELLVLLVIGYEVVSSVWHKRKIRRRSKQIFKFISKGRQLEDNSPALSASTESDVAVWNKSVNTWITETANFLRKYSPQAEASFLQGVFIRSSYRGVHPEAQLSFGLLLFRLEKLNGIIERQEVYFF